MQVISTEVKKGAPVKEIATGKTVELGRGSLLELNTPTTVRVLETIEYGEEREVSYEKLLVKYKGGIRADELFFGANSMNCRGEWCTVYNANPLCCAYRTEVEHVKDEYITDIEHRNIATKRNVITSGKVFITINRAITDEIVIRPDGRATVHLEKYFDRLSDKSDIRVTFQYKKATTNSEVTYSEARKKAISLLPHYRKHGSENRSARDYIVAFAISNDLSDLNEARKYALLKEDLSEIDLLQIKYNDEADLLQLNKAAKNGTLHEFIRSHPNSKYLKNAESLLQKARYEQMIEKECKDSVIEYDAFVEKFLSENAKKGTCVSLNDAAVFEQKSIDAGLYEIPLNWFIPEQDRVQVVYIHFDSAGKKKRFSEAVVKYAGKYRYLRADSKMTSVPAFNYLTEVVNE